MLTGAEGGQNKDGAAKLSVERDTVGKWRGGFGAARGRAA
ncbi:Putative transposase (fragment) [Bradyrhizobium sp. ORS 285]